MTDNGNGRHVTRIVRTHDLVSGEELLIVYFSRVDQITINGDSVTRSLGFGSRAGQSVFQRHLGNKKFTVATDSVNHLYV